MTSRSEDGIDVEEVSRNEEAQRMTVTTRDANETKNVKIENCVGYAKTPLGLAGPLTVHGQQSKDSIFAPLATSEATLVASCSRGCKALQRSGGVHATVLAESMARAPVFRFETIEDAVRFYRDVMDFFSDFKTAAEKTSRRVKLKTLTPHLIGTCVHVKFDYLTGSSAGQNMTTIATQSACEAFMASPNKNKYRLQGFLVEGQFSSDKKLSWGNVASPRGVQTVAWATIPNDVCEDVLGNSASNLFGTYLYGVQAGIRNGFQGYNINTANVLAALFIATGQDAASVLEGGWSQLTVEYNQLQDALIVSLFFPSLPVGVVGGGTSGSTQLEALELMKCTTNGSKYSLAEKITSFALALEISTLSAIANNTFSQSHQRLARAKI